MTVVSAPASHNPGPGAFDEPDMGGVDMNGSGGNPYHQSMRQHFATLPRKVKIVFILRIQFLSFAKLVFTITFESYFVIWFYNTY